MSNEGTCPSGLLPTYIDSRLAVVPHRSRVPHIGGISELFDSQPSRASFIPNAQLMTVPRCVTLLKSTVELTIKERCSGGSEAWNGLSRDPRTHHCQWITNNTRRRRICVRVHAYRSEGLITGPKQTLNTMIRAKPIKVPLATNGKQIDVR